MEQPINNTWETRIAAFGEKFPAARSLGGEMSAFLEAQGKDIVSDEKCLEKALLHVLAERYIAPASQKETQPQAETPAQAEAQPQAETRPPLSKEAVIAEYIAGIRADAPHIPQETGALPVLPPFRPKSIGEAGEIAFGIIKNIIK